MRALPFVPAAYSLTEPSSIALVQRAPQKGARQLNYVLYIGRGGRREREDRAENALSSANQEFCILYPILLHILAFLRDVVMSPDSGWSIA